MSTTDHTRFDALMSRYLDASLEGAEEHELLRCLSDEDNAARFHELTRLDTEIAGLLAGSIPDEVMVGLIWSDLGGVETPTPPDEVMSSRSAVTAPVAVRGQSKKHTGRLLALAAVLAGVLGLAAFFFFRTPAQVNPVQIASLHGEVYLVGEDGRTPVSSARALGGEGTVQTVGPDSHATLTLMDGTRIEVLGDTTFTASGPTGKQRLFLDQGVIRCSVAKQPTDAPMVFHTAGAMATVRGTDLTIFVAKSETLLVVTHGAVALRRSSGGPELLVQTGFYSRVEVTGKFSAWPLARLPKADRDRVLPPE